ncbi:hypothetical protein D3C86_1795120 [compost metagenome]
MTLKPGIAMKNGVVRYVHMAYPLKYARCNGSQGVSMTCPANASRGFERSRTISPWVVSMEM